MKKIISIILILLVVLIIINIIPSFKKGLGNFVFKIFSPISGLFNKIGQEIAEFFRIFANISKLNKENIDLQQKNLILEAEIAKLKEIQRENILLGENIKQAALVVGKDIQGTQDWILINKGTKHGIQKNMTVVSPEKALVGEIIEAQNNFSKAMLITNKDSAIAALVAENRIGGLVKKNQAGGLIMDLIPKTEKLEIGQTIITSGMDNIFPKGILIGKIESIDASENQIFQKIFITPAVNFDKLEEVIILK